MLVHVSNIYGKGIFGMSGQVLFACTYIYFVENERHYVLFGPLLVVYRLKKKVAILKAGKGLYCMR